VLAGDRLSTGDNPGQVTVHTGLDARVRRLPGGLRARWTGLALGRDGGPPVRG
jgi:hypothetical protein